MSMEREFDIQTRALGEVLAEDRADSRRFQQRQFEALGRSVQGVQSAVNILARRGQGKGSFADTLIKAAVCEIIAVSRRQKPEAMVGKIYQQEAVTDRVKAFIASPREAVQKAANAPMMTTDSSLSALLTSGALGLIATLAPSSLYARLAAAGLRVQLEGYKNVRMPYRASAAGAASPFTGEGGPISVRGATLAATTLAPAKAALISFFTAEVAQHSIPAMEAIVGTILNEDLSIGIDKVLLSADAATAISPGGILNGVTPITGTGDLASDLAQLIAAFDPAPTAPAIITSPATALTLALSLSQPLPMPVLTSPLVTAGDIIALDLADFASAIGDDTELRAVEDAAIVTSDPAAPISTGTSGAGADTAAPVVSMFQQNMISVRVLEFVAWALRRPGRVAVLQTGP